MSSKIHPQARAQSAMLSMVEARGGAGLGQAEEWLSRGWNPFLPQSGSRGPAAIEVMSGDYLWVHWLAERKAKASALFEQAFPLGENGLRVAGRVLSLAAARAHDCPPTLLELLLEMGADPNPPPQLDPSPFNQATAHGAKILAAAGGRPRPSPGFPSSWEAWAGRVAHQKLSIADLDWMEQLSPPSLGGITKALGPLALRAQNAKLVERLARLGGGAELLGLAAPARLSEQLCLLARFGDSHLMISAIISACGAGPVLDAAQLRLPGGHSALEIALLLGRTRSLGVLESAGLLRLPGLSALELAQSNAALWAAVDRLRQEAPRLNSWMRRSPHGAVWCMTRIPASLAAEAAQALVAHVQADPQSAAPAVLTGAAKGFLAPSGPLGVCELYSSGAAWPDTSSLGSFSEFVAQCEAKMLRDTSKKKPAPKARMRL